MSDSLNPAPAGDNNTDATGEPEAGAGSPPSPESPDANALAARLRKREKELQQAQQKLQQLEQAQADKAKADMSEVERYKSEAEQYRKQVEETQARFQESQRHSAFRFAAQQAGVIDVDAALKLADLSVLEFDGDEVTGADAAVKALKKSKPYLFGSTPPPNSSGGGGANPASGAPQGRTLSAKQIEAMSTAEYAKIKPLIASGEIKLIP